MTLTSSAFALSDRLAAKASPSQIAEDDARFAAIGSSLEGAIAASSARLESLLKAPGRSGQDALERDLEIHRLGSRLRALRRFGLDVCLGRMVRADDAEPVYIGRLGLTDTDGRRLLVDWRSAAAEPFFGATHANPMGLASRRRYQWTRGRVSDYWDEVFGADVFDGGAALDDQSAFIATLGSSRSSRMRDVLGTIQADQDAIIRAGSRGALVVDGGPGTGKTVVALHRTAYLLYSDPRLAHSRGGVLFVGPHPAYLAYVGDVLPNLGEDGVDICTLRDLVPEGATALVEKDPEVARLKASDRLTQAIENAVRRREVPPDGMEVETPWADVWLEDEDWQEAFENVDLAAPHNEAREQVWEEVLALIADKHDPDVPSDMLRRSLLQNEELRAAFDRAWPLLDPVRLVETFWSSPSFLSRSAPWLTTEEVVALQRADAGAWTVSDLPILDAARQRIGDPTAARRHRQRAVAIAEEREGMARVIDDLVAAEELDDGEGLMTILRGQDAQNSLVDEAALPSIDPDALAGPFAHIVVDEAQELTDAEWQMLLRRCPSRSFTVVGDRAQARNGFTESWEDRLRRIGLSDVTVASLTINYRTPSEVMAEAEPIIRTVLPDANVPTSVRSSGIPVVHGSPSDLTSIVNDWLAAHDDGIACVIGDPEFDPVPRVRSRTPENAKGLEFDLVVLVEPARWGAVDQYVAMTRATRRLVILQRAAAR